MAAATAAKRTKPTASTYDGWRKSLLSDPATAALYEQEGAKKELWLQLVEARQAAGLTQAQVARRLGVSQAQVARIEKRGYDSYTLKTLRRFVEALGHGFSVEVRVRQVIVAKPRRSGSGRAVHA